MASIIFTPDLTEPVLENSVFVKKEIDCYSQINEDTVEFNDSGLPTYAIPRKLRKHDGNFLMNIKRGLTPDFKYKVFGEDESRIGNLLRVMMHYESKETEGKTIDKPRFVSHAGLYKDIAVNDGKYPYDVVCFDGQIFFSSTDRRLDNTAETSYTGIKFEQFLTNATPQRIVYKKLSSSIEHFKTLNKVYFKGMKREVTGLTVSELDAVKSKEEDVASRQYVEMKSTICRNCKINLRTLSRQDLLHWLSKSSGYFTKKVFSWLTQSLFNEVSFVVVGVRDPSFNIHTIREYSVDELAAFLKVRNSQLYEKYIRSVDYVSQVLEWVTSIVEEDKIYSFVITNSSFKLEEVSDSTRAQDIKDNVLIKEFRDWREHKVLPKGIEVGMSLSTLPATISDVEDITSQLTSLDIKSK